MSKQRDLALTTFMLLVNASGCEFEDDELAVIILEELIIKVKNNKP